MPTGRTTKIGKGWKIKDGKPVKTGKGKSVSQKIAERKKPKTKWGKAMNFIAIAATCFAAAALPEVSAQAAKKVCNTWTHQCWFENEAGQVIKRPQRKVHRHKERPPQVRAYVKREHERDEDRVSCFDTVRVVGSQWANETGAEESAQKAWMERVRWGIGESAMSIEAAKDYAKRCSRSSVGEIANQVLHRCEVQARPCKPVFESK